MTDEGSKLGSQYGTVRRHVEQAPPEKITSVARSGEVERVLDFLSSASRDVAILFGRKAIGKTELVQQTVESLHPENPGYYGSCEGDFPARYQGRDPSETVEQDLWGLLDRGAFVFVDNLDTVLDRPRSEWRQILGDVFARLARGSRGTLVLTLREDQLGEVFGFRDDLPQLLDAVLEIHGISAQSAVDGMVEQAKVNGFDYTEEAREALMAEIIELDKEGFGPDPELLGIIDERVRRWVSLPDHERTVDLADLEELGGVVGILRESVETRLRALHMVAVGRQELAAAALREVAVSSGGATDWEWFRRRQGVSERVVDEVLEWLGDPGRLLTRCPTGEFRLIPSELEPILQRQASSRRAKANLAEEALAIGVNSWFEMRVLLPKDQFEEVHRHRRELVGMEGAGELMVQCSLVYESDERLEAARYWLGRIRSESDRLDLLLDSLYDWRGDVRRRAAVLLGALRGEPARLEAQSQLYLLALGDPIEEVRSTAVAILGELESQLGQTRVVDRLRREIRNAGSEHRVAAVEALRVFPHRPETAQLLQEVIEEDQPDELRRKAIEVLGKLETDEAVSALCNIGLFDSDKEDREGAGDELGEMEHDRLARVALRELRSARFAPEVIEASAAPKLTWKKLPFVLIAKFVGGGLLLLLNALLHGSALLLLRFFSTERIRKRDRPLPAPVEEEKVDERWKPRPWIQRYGLGLAFLGVGAVSVTVLVMTADSDSPLWPIVALTVLLVNWVFSQLVPYRDIAREERQFRQRPGSLEEFLSFPLLVGNLIGLFPIHGLAHLVFGRIRSGIGILVVQIVGIACGLTATFLGAAFEFRIWGVSIKEGAEFSYAVVGTFLFLASYVYDLKVLGREPGAARKQEIYQKMVSNPVAANVVLEWLHSPERTERAWAKRTLRQLAEAFHPGTLIEHMLGTAKARNRLVKTLAAAKDQSATDELTSHWAEGIGVSRWTILKTLARKPQESSLGAIRELEPRTWGCRMVFCWAWFQYRVAQWPKSVVLGLALGFPVLVSLVVGGTRSLTDPGWREAGVVANETLSTHVRIKAVKNLAFSNPSRAVEPLGELLKSTAQPGLMDAAIDGLRRVALESREWETGPKAVAALARAMETVPKDETRIRLAWALASVASRGSLEMPQRPGEAETGSGFINNASSRAVAELSKALQSDERGQALRVLPLFAELVEVSPEQLEAPRTIQALQQFISAPSTEELAPGGETFVAVPYFEDLEQRRMAVDVLERIGTPRAHLALRELVDSETLPSSPLAEAVRMAAAGIEPLERIRHALEDQGYELVIKLVKDLNSVSGEDRARLGLDSTQVQTELLSAQGRANFGLSQRDPARASSWRLEAIRTLERARDLAPDSVLDRSARFDLSSSYAARANELRLQESYEQAVQLAGMAIEIVPDYSFAFSVRALAYYGLGQQLNALRDVEAVTEQLPASAWGYCWQSALARELGRPQESLALARRAIEVEPADRCGYGRLRESFHALGQDREAIETFDELRADSSEEGIIWPWTNAIFVYHDYLSDDPGSFEKAYELSTELLATWPHLAQEVEYLGAHAENALTGEDLQVAEGRGKEALALLEARPEDQEHKWPIEMIVYASLVFQGRFAEAETRLGELDPSQRPEGASRWNLTGTKAFVEKSNLEERLKMALLSLLSAEESGDREGLDRALQASRAALVSQGS